MELSGGMEARMRWNVFQWRSLNTKIVLATLSIFLAGIWTLSFYAIQMLRQDMERLLSEQQFSTVSLVAAQIEQGLSSRIKALEMVAATAAPVLQEGSTAAMQSFLEQRPALQTLFNGGILIHSMDGTAVADFPSSFGRRGVNYMDVDPIAAALKEGKSSIGRPVPGKKLKAPVFGMAVPVLDSNGKIIGALSGVINLGFPNFLDQISENHFGKTGGYLLVVPQHRLIVTATDKNRVMETLPPPGVNSLIDRFIRGYEGSGVTINPRGQEVLVSAKNIPVAGWYAVASLPTGEAFEPVRDMQRRMLFTTILLTLLAGWGIWRLLKSQLSPLLDAAETLMKMSSETGKSLQSLPIVRQDEIGQLIGGFNQLLTTLGQREALLKQILDTSSVAIFLVDREGRITQANQRMAEMFGYPLDTLLGSDYVNLVHPSEREIGRQAMLALLGSQVPSVDLDRLYWRADQTEFWGHLTGRCLYDANGEKQGLVGVIADINVRKLAEDKLHLAASVFTHAREGILITDANGVIVDVNDAFSRITGYSREEVLGQNPRLFKSGHHDPAFYAAMWRDLIENGHWAGEVWNRRKNGEVYAEMKTISAVRDLQGNTQCYVALFSDITSIKAHEKQLEHMAHYDVLTTLPNRVLLADRLHQAMAQTLRHKQLLAVAYLDLDGFKAINDGYGHETGDQLLICLAQNMKQTLREGDTLARLGGDEFVAVLLDLEDVASSVSMLSRLLAAAAKPVPIGDAVLSVSASLGVTFYPQTEGVDADQLLRQADQAMYQAKVAGKNRYHVFDSEQDRSVRGHHESIQRISKALNADEFVLYYQPKVNMRTGVIVGAEALIRWQHPEKGLLLPAAFLPVIESHSLAIDIGEWVVDTVLTQMERWRACGLDIPVSVNVGARQLQHGDFVMRLRKILDAHPSIPPNSLELEVLETSALEDLIRVSQLIEDCKKFGVRFALDDFGTGYSSLTYLKRLSVDQLKIDQSFVRDMLEDTDDLAILEGVISLASAFRREVIAEGVESVEHGEMLLQLGCELAQGYGIARPMPAADFPGWASAWRPDPAWKHVSPVGHDDLPLLFASVEHRAWIVAMEKHLRAGFNTLPPQDTHLCGFGTWLNVEGRARYGSQPAFQSLESIHRQVHALALELCDLKAANGEGAALARLGEFHDLRDILLARLKTLLSDCR